VYAKFVGADVFPLVAASIWLCRHIQMELAGQRFTWERRSGAARLACHAHPDIGRLSRFISKMILVTGISVVHGRARSPPHTVVLQHLLERVDEYVTSVG
jgi:hypothetical protein